MAKLKVGDLIPLATAEDLEKVEEKLKDAEYTPYLTNYNIVFTAGEGYDKEGNAVDYSDSVVNGQVSSVGIKGNTITNLLGDLGADIKKIGRSTATESKYPLNNLKPLTEYTLIFNVSDVVVGNGGAIQVSLTSGTTTATNFPNTVGIKKYKFTTPSNFDNTKQLWVYFTTADYDGGARANISNVMIVEGDWTTRSINSIEYISGTKSTVGAIRLKGVGKNLVPKNTNVPRFAIIEGRECIQPQYADNFTSIQSEGIFYAISTNVFYKYANIKFKPNTQYTLQLRGQNLGTNTAIRIIHTDGSSVEGSTAPDFALRTLTSTIGKTVLAIVFYHQFWGQNTAIDLDSIMLYEGTQATEYEPYKESTMYVVGRDEEGNILELCSLPNGVADRIYQAKDGQWYVEKNTKEYILQESDILYFNTTDNNNFDTINIPKFDDMAEFTIVSSGQVILEGYNTGIGAYQTNFDRPDYVNSIIASKSLTGNYFIVTLEKGKYSSIAEVRADLVGTKLIYQLAEPVKVPIQVTGNLKVYKNGSIFVDFIMPRKDNYGEDGINVGIPIKEIVSLYKVEKESGVERELNISNVEFSSDKTSFIHPDLEEGDLVKWEFVPDIETTTPITAIKYPINLKGQIENNSNAIQKISKDIDILDAKIIGNTQSIEDLSNKVGHNKQGIEELFTQVDSNKAGIESLDVRVTDNRNAIDQIGVIAVENQNMLADIVPQVNANRDNIEILEVEVNSVKSSVDGLNNRITETEQDMGSVQGEINSLKQHKEQLNNYLRVDSNGNFIIGTQDNPSNIRVSDEGVTVTANRLYIGNFVIEKYNNDILIIRPIE